jgi:pimeloyl-ACP methyl ester carboxylesterase
MLHGGSPGIDERTTRWSSWYNLERLQRTLFKKLDASALSVWLLRHSKRGWDEDDSGHPQPVVEAWAALDDIQRSLNLPVVLVGHSMGGRTAVLVADHQTVVGVVALSPWVDLDVSVAPLSGKQFAATSGDPDFSFSTDGGTPIEKTREFTRRASAVTSSKPELKPLGISDHNLFLRRHAVVNFAASKVQAFLNL